MKIDEDSGSGQEVRLRDVCKVRPNWGQRHGFGRLNYRSDADANNRPNIAPSFSSQFST